MKRLKYDHHIAKEQLLKAAELMWQAQESIQIAVALLRSESEQVENEETSRHWREVANIVEPAHDAISKPASICSRQGRF